MSEFDILTSQNVFVKYDTAGVGNRIAAAAIDYGFFFIWGLISIVVENFGFNAGPILTFITIFLPVILYHPVMEIFFNGQSVGKMMMKIRVMKTDGSKPTVTAYLLRSVFRLLDISISMGSIAVTTIAFTEKSQRIGDIAAGTTVIRLKARTKLKELVPVSREENYQPVFSEVVALSDKDIQLLKKVLHKQHTNKDLQLVANMVSHVKKVTAIETGMDDMQLLYTVLKDYEHYALQEKSAV
jgi:uncharacterized RDD family membrane protein YckC